MTVVVDDPLIARMSISRALPLHESSRRLRELYPECPRVYGVAVMSDLSPSALVAVGRSARDRPHGGDVRGLRRGVRQPRRRRPPVGGHAGPRRHRAGGPSARPSRAGPGTRVWRTSGSTSTPRRRSTGWASSTPPCGRSPTTRHFVDRTGLRRRQPSRDRIFALPNEAALATWVAHRSHRSLTPLFDRLLDVSGGVMSVASMWHVVGTAVVSAATQVPLLAGSSEFVSMRRGPGRARRTRRVRRARARLGSGPGGQGLAKLGQPCLLS